MMSSAEDFKDFWNEYKFHQERKLKDDNLTEEFSLKQDEEEGEQDAELLRAMGMGHLTEAFKQGREITDAELGESLRQLSKIQADTVKRRVRSLNQTVRTRYGAASRQSRGWHRKPDIRDVFRDVETSSTGTRSRSATPDSLDSLGNVETEPDRSGPWTPPDWETLHRRSPPPSLIGSVPDFVKIFNHPSVDVQNPTGDEIKTVPDEEYLSGGSKETLRRTPSAPPSCHRNGGATASSYPPVLPLHEMFRRPGPWPMSIHRVDVASDSEGIELLHYNRIGTIHLPRQSRERVRSDSDPTTSTLRLSHLKLGNSNNINIVPSTNSQRPSLENSVSISRNSNGIANDNISCGPVSFETIFHQNVYKKSDSDPLTFTDTRISVDSLSDLDFRDLKPILWLEICAVLDKYSLVIRKRKPHKRKRKEDGNVFGVNLSTLVMRDSQLLDDNSGVPVPLIFRTVLSRLSDSVRDEGILRVAGHKQKVEVLCNEIESSFYTKHEEVNKMIRKASSHDITAIFKRLLRELPQPLFTVELIDLFYQTHAISFEEDQTYILNMLVLLLPVENRSTFYALLMYLIDLVKNQESNKMNLHNVAMIIAPSLFPPRYIVPSDKNDINAQLTMAATCCHLVERFISAGDVLKTVPLGLLNQARRCSRDAVHRKRRKDQKVVRNTLGGKKEKNQ